MLIAIGMNKRLAHNYELKLRISLYYNTIISLKRLALTKMVYFTHFISGLDTTLIKSGYNNINRLKVII